MTIDDVVTAIREELGALRGLHEAAERQRGYLPDAELAAAVRVNAEEATHAQRQSRQPAPPFVLTPAQERIGAALVEAQDLEARDQADAAARAKLEADSSSRASQIHGRLVTVRDRLRDEAGSYDQLAVVAANRNRGSDAEHHRVNARRVREQVARWDEWAREADKAAADPTAAPGYLRRFERGHHGGNELAAAEAAGEQTAGGAGQADG